MNIIQLSFWKLWSLKLALNLLPMTIDPIANQWKDSITGIGASIDSFMNMLLNWQFYLMMIICGQFSKLHIEHY